MAKNYVKWSAKLVKTQYGDLINVSLNVEDLQRLPQTKGYVKITLAPRKEIWQYWDTHYIYENDFVPTNWWWAWKSSQSNDWEELPF